jgi:hypothetical protein
MNDPFQYELQNKSFKKGQLAVLEATCTSIEQFLELTPTAMFRIPPFIESSLTAPHHTSPHLNFAL